MKALILYTNTGAGHVSAAKAISEMLQNLGVTTIQLDTLNFAGKSTSKVIENSYINIVRKSPNFFGLLYKAGAKISNPKIKSIIYILNILYSDKVYNIIQNEQPDLIVCTHLFCAQTISYIKKNYSINAITSAIITDYTWSPFWEETKLDYYFIPHKDLVDEFINKGMDKTNLLPFGLPVSSKFKTSMDKNEAKASLNLTPNIPHILIMGGSMGAGNIFDTSIKLSSNFKDVQFTVICGNNTELYEKFMNNSHNTNLNILKFTTSIDKLMDSADILITKPGGLTSTEAMVKGLPIILMNPIPGVESANKTFFLSHNMALYSNSIEEAIDSCNLLLHNQETIDNIIASQNNNINSNAAMDIANFLISKVYTRRK